MNDPCPEPDSDILSYSATGKVAPPSRERKYMLPGTPDSHITWMTPEREAATQPLSWKATGYVPSMTGVNVWKVSPPSSETATIWTARLKAQSFNAPLGQMSSQVLLPVTRSAW
jgi:hypothetical protein